MDEVDQDNNDLYGGFTWAKRWQTVFFVFDCCVMIVSLGINLCLLRYPFTYSFHVMIE